MEAAAKTHGRSQSAGIIVEVLDPNIYIKCNYKKGEKNMSMDRLRSLYYGLYGENGITNFFYDQLLEIMETAKANRSPQLKRRIRKEIPGICQKRW